MSPPSGSFTVPSVPHINLFAFRTRVGEAMRDMPEHQGIATLLSGAHINYFHCLKIVEILKETEADSKNFFGQYGSQRMKDWKEIVSLYQRDSLYLAEAAQLLTQNVVYEIPGLRKSLVRCDNVEEECDKQEESSHRKEKELLEFEKEQFRKDCVAWENEKELKVVKVSTMPAGGFSLVKSMPRFGLPFGNLSSLAFRTFQNRD